MAHAPRALRIASRPRTQDTRQDTPRDTRQDTPRDTRQQRSSYPSTDTETLAQWLTDAQHDPSGALLWQMYASPTFAQLWYGARMSGETLRARALEHLYTRRDQPGGAHPDPREPAAYSAQAVLAKAASLIGLRTWQVPETFAHEADLLSYVTHATAPTPATHATQATTPTRRPPLAWLVTYEDHRPPDIAVRYTPRIHRLHHQMACVIGYVCKERHRLLDPDAPTGITLLPTDPSLVTILHQFAIGLLCLEKECPPDWTCHCNAIRQRFNAAPTGHEQPTDILAISALRAEVQRQKREILEREYHRQINSGELKL